MKDFISRNFIPIRIHIKERPKDFERFKAEWTPTVILAEPDGTERYRFSGFLPEDDFLAELQLGLGRAAFSRGQFKEAETDFNGVVNEHAQSVAAPEAIYWRGVSAYKATNNPEPLKRAGETLREKYPDSEWAKKSSVWLG